MNNIADKPGEYTDFTGSILYKDINCDVKDATFELLKKRKKFKGKINIDAEFKKGEVIVGKLTHVNIKCCIFYGDRIEESVWHDGIFDGNRFHYSYWLDGEWESGEWAYSFDKFGRARGIPPIDWDNDLLSQTSGIASRDGSYEGFNGTIRWAKNNLRVKDANFELGNLSANANDEMFFHSGVVLGGVADEITVNYCIWEDGIWTGGSSFESEWHNGVWKGGTWEDGRWHDGTFDGGTWKDGEWYGGIWLDGEWEGGHWFHGYDWNGRFHNDSPNNWGL